MIASAFAAAKVNLFLHIGPLRADGYHPVCSLMAFADLGDRLRLEPGAPGFAIEGAFAPGLAGDDPADNLVLRAAQALIGAAALPGRLVLDKALPVASGLGGGSADAAAALRLLGGAPDPRLHAIAAALGSDVPACLESRPVIAEGRGEVLTPAPPLPELPAVLVNPDIACPTGPVYRAYDAGPPRSADRPAWPARLETPAEAAAWLSALRNDLEPAACAVAPAVAEVLARVRSRPEPLLTRLSGSGATVFALCADDGAAARLAAALSADRPGWWVRPCRLGGPLGLNRPRKGRGAEASRHPRPGRPAPHIHAGGGWLEA